MNKLNLQWDLPDLKPGLSRTIQKTIGESDNLAYGHGALTELLPTPPLTALMIEAAIQVVDPLLPQGYVTVATSFSVTYLSPTFLGATITVVATLVGVEGKGLVFDLMAFDELGQVGRGRHERYIVNSEHFMDTARKRCEPIRKIIK
ncbi:MAG TPA: hotdog domain-containing protein [Syntrophales bacterium]|nr:hotdog domain-containing protein [Syntrophales bacterium]HPQ61185.1 hotdog domain-containing protein [Syntrophales bacterium]